MFQIAAVRRQASAPYWSNPFGRSGAQPNVKNKNSGLDQYGKV